MPALKVRYGFSVGVPREPNHFSGHTARVHGGSLAPWNGALGDLFRRIPVHGTLVMAEVVVTDGVPVKPVTIDSVTTNVATAETWCDLCVRQEALQ